MPPRIDSHGRPEEGGLTLHRSAITLGLLILVNTLPLVGVLLFEWRVGDILVLYWSENLVLGFYTLVKMITRNPLGGFFTGIFFVVHYGGFCAVHGLFVLALAMDTEPSFLQGGGHWPFFFIFVELLFDVIRQVLAMAPPEWLIAFLALFVSHGVSLLLNYYRGGEYRDQSAKSLMISPYKRIVVLHVALIVGGFGVMALGSPLPLLIMLVLLKTALDVVLHHREHRTSTGDPDADSASAAR